MDALYIWKDIKDHETFHFGVIYTDTTKIHTLFSVRIDSLCDLLGSQFLTKEIKMIPGELYGIKNIMIDIEGT